MAVTTIWTATIAAALVGRTSLQALADGRRDPKVELPREQVLAEQSGTTVSSVEAPITSPSGIEGQVWIGQGCPGPSGADPECSARLSALTISVLDATGRVIEQLHPDADGRFQVALSPGMYTVHPELGPWINAPEQTVGVPDARFAQIRVVYVSGVR